VDPIPLRNWRFISTDDAHAVALAGEVVGHPVLGTTQIKTERVVAMLDGGRLCRTQTGNLFRLLPRDSTPPFPLMP
jgi:hypothetical protein